MDTAVEAKPKDRIHRQSLHDELVQRLRDMIVHGELHPGQRVAEKALCERFGVSRTPLREALKVLASEGLVVLAPNRGATIATLTIEEVDEIFPVMAVLEALAGKLACERITEDRVAEIKALHYQMVAHHRRKELAPYFTLNQAIHEAILEAAGNSTLAAMSRSLAGRIRRARYMANMSQSRWDQAVAEHEDILAALSRREGEKLGRILQRHLENKAQVVKESLISLESEPSR